MSFVPNLSPLFMLMISITWQSDLIELSEKLRFELSRMFDWIFTRIVTETTVRCQSLSDCWLRFNLEKAKVHPPSLFPISQHHLLRQKSRSRDSLVLECQWSEIVLEHDVQDSSKLLGFIIRNILKTGGAKNGKYH